MNIRLQVSLLFLLFLIPIVFLASYSDLQDSTSTSSQDSTQTMKSDSTRLDDFLNWVEKRQGLIEFLALLIAAITALCASIAWIIRLRRRLKQAEVDYQKLIAQNQARLEAMAMHKAQQQQKKLETEEDRYLDFVITKNEKLTFQGFETAVKTPILLWDVYVPLRANIAGTRRLEMPGAGYLEIQENKNITIEEAVQLATDKKYDGLIILGDPGAGKTTLLRYFLLCFAKKEAAKRLNLPGDLLPILLPLRSADLNKTFIQNICEQFHDYDLKLSEPFFLDRLEKGRAIVLLDGLDEVADETARKQMCQWIDKSRTRFRRCPFIVTSRFAGYRGDVRLPGSYLELNMQDFSKKDIRQFLHSWYTTVETTIHEDNNFWRTEAQKSAEELYNRIAGSEAYLKLAINPLMLQLIALVHYDFKTVPDRRVELYEKCTDLLLQKWDEAKGLKTLLSAKEARQVLQPLALWMHSVENRRQAEEKEVLAQITPHIQQVKPGVPPQQFLTSMRDRSGVFVGYGTETYGFQHLSFQEYLTAEEIRNKSKVEILVEHFDESWWREPTLLALGLANPSIFEPFMAKFMMSDKNNGGAADFMLRCLKETLVKSETPLIEVLHNEKIRWQARYNAMLCLQIIGSTIAIDAVEKVLHDPRKEIAAKARDMLVEWKRIRVAEVKERDARTGLPTRIFNLIEYNAEYILIPEGSYTMGRLQKQETVKPFYLAKYTVTNRLYRKFVQDTKHREPTLWNDKKYNADDQPVVRVSWDDAVAYCDWLTKTNKDKMKFRLSSEAEWEWAAGRGERKYPWSNEEPDHNRANYDSKVGYPTPVGSYPSGATPDGLMDMAGNVWEWCADWYDEKSKSSRVVRGGSWFIFGFLLSCSYRYGDFPDNCYAFVGFRVSCGA